MALENGRFLAGLLTGALVGASLAMVLAPGSPQEMRETLRAKARDVAERTATLAAPESG